jgi:hypothetical protein
MVSSPHSLPYAQAKEYDVYDTAPFLRSKLFAANGYKVNDGIIEKRFRTGEEGREADGL